MKLQKENFNMEIQITQTTELVLGQGANKSLARKTVSTNGTETIAYELPQILVSKTTKDGSIIAGEVKIGKDKFVFDISDDAAKFADSLKQLETILSANEYKELDTLLAVLESHKSLSAPEVLEGKNFSLSREAALIEEDGTLKSVVRFISSSADPETIYTIGDNFVSTLHTEKGVDYLINYNGKETELSAEKIAKAKFGSRDYKTKEMYLKATRMLKSLEFLKKILNGERTMEETLANRIKNSSNNQPNN